MTQVDALMLPTTERLLRGVRTTLAEMDLNQRPDLQHAVSMIDKVLTHLLLRQDLGPYPELYAEMAKLAHTGKALLTAADRTLLQAIDALTPQLPGGLSFDAVQAHIGAALACLRDLVSVAVSGGRLQFVQQVQSLEERFYNANTRAPQQPLALAHVSTLNPQRFAAHLHERFPGTYQTVTRFQRLVGGFQKETIVAEAALAAGGSEAMVIRAEKHDRFVRFTASDIADEHAIVRVLWQTGVPIAEPLWLQSSEEPRFMVSRYVEGRNTGDAMGSSAQFPDELSRSLIETLVRIHAVPLDERVTGTRLGAWLQHATLAENTLAEIRAWRHQIWLDRAPPSPAFERIFDWLEANVPSEEGESCVLHNDYGPHNIRVRDNRVQAVLDWEVCRLGDPAEDVSFFLQCCGTAIDREAALALYARLSGRRLSEYRLRYFDVLSCAKVLVSGLSATTMYQATEPALLDWCQMPILWMVLCQRQVEDKIARAEAVRGR